MSRVPVPASNKFTLEYRCRLRKIKLTRYRSSLTLRLEVLRQCAKDIPLGTRFEHWCHIYDCVILCHCTLAAALYFEQSSCDELMEFKQIQTRAQPEESLKHNHTCTVAQTCHRSEEAMAVSFWRSHTTNSVQY